MKLRWWNKILTVLFFAALTGCSSKPAWEFMPDMMDQPSLKAQESAQQLPHGRSLLTPPEGTIPRGFTPYPYKGDPEGAGANLKNPLSKSQETVLTGEKTFKVYCAVCHGETGFGDGPVIPKFPAPPSLHSDKVRGWSDGRIFHVITEGQGLMPSYASQLDAEQRWAAIHYLRALQKAVNPTAEDVKAYEQTR
ncbi:MAG: cytochrome c [Deltaproteobacteria bacterium]|nr:cytochrome c [Deltaproteobacteria bacterium]